MRNKKSQKIIPWKKSLVTEQVFWACAFSSQAQLVGLTNQYHFEEPVQTPNRLLINHDSTNQINTHKTN